MSPLPIAVIDSGVDPLSLRHAHLRQSLRISPAGEQMRFSRCLTDPIGHGTACIELIGRLAPGVEIHSLAITDAEGGIDPGALTVAIDWCIRHRMRVVNISLGTTDTVRLQSLAVACDRAAAAGVFIVAAEHNDGIVSYPAHCASTLGVRAGRLRADDELIFAPGQAVQCIARGDRQRLSWRGGQERMIGGSSFAAARVTAMVAQICRGQAAATLRQVEARLRARATRVLSEVPVLSTCAGGTSGIGTRAALYPFTKEMHALVRFRDLLPFQITGVADPPGRRMVGRDAGEALRQPPLGVSVAASLPRALEGADCLVLGYVRKLGRIQRRDLLRQSVTQALDQQASVFSFDGLEGDEYADLHARGRRLGAILRSPRIRAEEAWQRLAAPPAGGSVDRPVLGVFGTSSAQGKFTLQLALRRVLLRRSYTIGQIGTEHHAELFGLDVGFPMGYAARVDLALEYWPEYLDRRMREICWCRRPDLMIVGSQSGTAPYDVHDPRTLTLPSLAFLLGTKPDVCILVVNSVDAPAYVEATIQVLASVGQTRVIALAVSDRVKVSGRWQGRPSTGTSVLDRAAQRSTCDHLRRTHGLPAFCIGHAADVERLADLVVEAFSFTAQRQAA